jgi:hypothetical protein
MKRILIVVVIAILVTLLAISFKYFRSNIIVSHQETNAEWNSDAEVPALVKSRDEFGYIDKNGNFTINPQFDNAEPFTNGRAAIKVGEKWSYVRLDSKPFVC